MTPLANRALELITTRHWSMVPSAGSSKGPCVKWRKYQAAAPAADDLAQWDERYRPERWGVVTGEFSGVIGIDFDGEQGAEWLAKWALDPHVQSPSGGHHVYFLHPGWLVPTMSAKSSDKWPFKGVDVRGDGGYINLLGGKYKILRDLDPYTFDCLPRDLGNWLRDHSRSFHPEIPPEAEAEENNALNPFEQNNLSHQNGSATQPLPGAAGSVLVRRALEMTSGTGRNDAGFWLAAQLRDNQVPLAEARSWILDYQRQAPSTNARGQRQPYTQTEALASLESAFNSPARAPWKPAHHTPYTNGSAAAHQAEIPQVEKKEPTPEQPDYAALLDAEIDRIIDGKLLDDCYQDSLIRLCVQAGDTVAFKARARLQAAFPRKNGRGLILKGVPGAWDVLYKAESDRQRQEQRDNPQRSWQDELRRSENGKLLPTYNNAALILQNSPDWSNVLAFNDFSGEICLREQPPDPVSAKPGEDLEDHFDTEVTRWFEERGLFIKPEVARRTVDREAHQHRFHPPRDYLNGLSPWDGTPRIGTWLFDYCQVARETTNKKGELVPDQFACEAGARFLISCVARIFDPGCQADHVLMLEGKTGLGKSTAVSALAGHGLSTSHISDFGSQNCSMQLRGIWIIEIADLHAFARQEREKIKAFITQREERFRLPYGRRITKAPRQCVFIGTTENSQWSTDERGARRFWPVKVTAPIDIEGIERDRDLLWAEALYRYRKGEKWYLHKPEVIKMAQQAQSDRYIPDAWEDKILPAADSIAALPPYKGASVGEILSTIGVETARQDDRAQMRCGKAMTRAGWERKQARMPGLKMPQWRYFPPPETEEEENDGA
jgi:predicted P-loop ATPase